MRLPTWVVRILPSLCFTAVSVVARACLISGLVWHFGMRRVNSWAAPTSIGRSALPTGLSRAGFSRGVEIHQSQTADQGCRGRESRADEYGDALAAARRPGMRRRQAEDQRHQRSARGLAQEPRRRDDGAGAAAALARRGGEDGAVVGRLEDAESDAAD